MKTRQPNCPNCRAAAFELRVMPYQDLASVRCVECSANYLLLDSKKYWFDEIQQGYPRVTRCSCGGTVFRLQIDYRIGDDGEIEHVKVHSICSACEKSQQRLSFKVDGDGTPRLLKNPLVACKNPKVFYDLHRLNLYVLLPDILSIVDHLAKEGCTFLTCLRRKDQWVLVRQKAGQVKASIENDKYLFVYAMPRSIDVPAYNFAATKKEGTFWKRSEVIRIGPKSHMVIWKAYDGSMMLGQDSERPKLPDATEVGLTFDIDFSNEFVRGEKAVAKSPTFRNFTGRLLAFLGEQLVSWRGPHCFDNPDVNVRIWGDVYKKKASLKAKR